MQDGWKGVRGSKKKDEWCNENVDGVNKRDKKNEVLYKASAVEGVASINPRVAYTHSRHRVFALVGLKRIYSSGVLHDKELRAI